MSLDSPQLSPAAPFAEPHLEVYAPEMSAKHAARIELEDELRAALRREEFVLYYQPKVDLRTNTICGAEALMRWNSPRRGLVQPEAFMSTLEQSGQIVEVGHWVIERAMKDYCDWTQEGLAVPRLSVNVAQRQLIRPDFVDKLRKAVGDRSCGAQALALEITESIMMTDVEQSIGKLQAARDLGLPIALDDFGSGYSSLAYLARLPITTIKIDRSFIIRMIKDADAMTIVSTIIWLAHSMNFQVAAEGVDSQVQLKILTLLKCDQVQGFLCSKPLSPADFKALLRNPRSLQAQRA